MIMADVDPVGFGNPVSWFWPAVRALVYTRSRCVLVFFDQDVNDLVAHEPAAWPGSAGAITGGCGWAVGPGPVGACDVRADLPPHRRADACDARRHRPDRADRGMRSEPGGPCPMRCGRRGRPDRPWQRRLTVLCRRRRVTDCAATKVKGGWNTAERGRGLTAQRTANRTTPRFAAGLTSPAC